MPTSSMANHRHRVTKRSRLPKIVRTPTKQTFVNHRDQRITARRSCSTLQYLMKSPICINHLSHIRTINQSRFQPLAFTFTPPKMTENAEPRHPPVCAEAQNPRILPISPKSEQPSTNGDLNNTASMRMTLKPERHPDFAYRSLSIPASMDEPTIRSRYRPFLLPDNVQQQDWVSKLELATVTELAYNDLRITGERIRVLILYGSLRRR